MSRSLLVCPHFGATRFVYFSASTLEIFSLVSCKKKPMRYTELTECYLDSIRAAEFGLFGRIISKIYLRA